MSGSNTLEATIGTCDIYINDLFVGYTADEVTLAVTRTVAELLAGLPLIPVVKVVTQEEVSASFEFKQISSENLSYAMGVIEDPDDVPGFDSVYVGGLTTLGATKKVDLVHAFPDAREFRMTMWTARPTPEFEMSFSSGDFVGIPVTFKAEEDSTKEDGKRLARIQIEKLTKS